MYARHPIILEEQEAFEKAFKQRGPSLLSQQQEGNFSDAKEAQDSARKVKAGAVASLDACFS